MSELIEFREAKDSFIAKDPHSPLTKEQKREFGGLSYYEEQRDLRLELQPEAYPEQETIEMQTSTGGVSRFIRSDKISFDADGESVQLTLYKDPESGDYFLPFADGTSGRETYGAGRYLDVQMLPDGKVLVDFNYAYNPYCASPLRRTGSTRPSAPAKRILTVRAMPSVQGVTVNGRRVWGC